MPSAEIFAMDGKGVGTVELDSELFGIEPNVHVMHQVVTAQLAAARRGTSKTKSRAQVRGGGAKPWRQKGTGRARHGSTRAPQWSGGGVAHGPSGEQNYTKRVNKKLKRLALRSALSDRAATGAVKVVRGLAFDAPKTRDAVAMLDALELADQRVLLVLGAPDEVVAKSFRNLSGIHLLSVDQLNTYDVLCSDVLVFAEEALDHVGKGTRPGQDAPSAEGGQDTAEQSDQEVA